MKTVVRMQLIDLLVLLYAVECGANASQVGFEDAEMTLKDMRVSLEREVVLSTTLAERAMWSANLLNELGRFWHPYGINFDQFIKRIIKQDFKFDKVYNLLLDRNSKRLVSYAKDDEIINQ